MLVVVRRVSGSVVRLGVPLLGAAGAVVRVVGGSVVVGRVGRFPLGAGLVGGAVDVLALGVPAPPLVAGIR